MSGSSSGRSPLKLLCALLCAIIGFSFAINTFDTNTVNADASTNVDNANGWGNAGQVAVSFWGASYYQTLTVVVEFSGTIDTIQTWNCDSYYVEGNRITLTVYADGAFGWIFSESGGQVGINVQGSDINSAQLISAYASGYNPPEPDPTEAPEPTPVPDTPTPVPATPTPKPQPTNTPKPNPTNTPRPKPTNTPKPNPTNTPRPKPTNTPKPNPTNTPKPKPTNTPKPNPTNTPKPKPTNTPKPNPTATSKPNPTAATNPTKAPTTAPTQNNGGAGGTTDNTTSGGNNNNPVNPDNSESVVAVVLETDVAGNPVETTVVVVPAGETVSGETVPVDENGDGEPDETTSETTVVVAGLTANGNNKKGPKKPTVSSWIWIAAFIIICGLLYIRYRYLKDKKDLEGKDLAIAYIPGVPAIAEKFGYLGPVKDLKPVEEPKENKSFNTATAMKEIKAMEATAQASTTAKGAFKPSYPSASNTQAKTAVQQKAPVKRPASLSVNHAKAVAESGKATNTAVRTNAPSKAATAAKTNTTSNTAVKTNTPLKANTATNAAVKTNSAAVKDAPAKSIIPKTTTTAPKTAAVAGSAAAAGTTARAESKPVTQKPPVKRPASISVNQAARANAERRAAEAKEANRPAFMSAVTKPVTEENLIKKPEDKPNEYSPFKKAPEADKSIPKTANVSMPKDEASPFKKPEEPKETPKVASAVVAAAVASKAKENKAAVQKGPVKRSKNEISPEQLAAREQAKKLLEERRAAQAKRVDEIRKNAEAKKAAAAVEKPEAEVKPEPEKAPLKSAEVSKAPVKPVVEEYSPFKKSPVATPDVKAAATVAAAGTVAAATKEKEQEAPAKRVKTELTPEQKAEAHKLFEERKAAQAKRIEEIKKNAEAKKAKALEDAKLAEQAKMEEELKKAQEAAEAAEKARMEELAKAEEAAKAAAAAKAEAEAKALEAKRIEEAAKAEAEAKALEAKRAREAAEQAKLAEAIKKAEDSKKAEELIKTEAVTKITEAANMADNKFNGETAGFEPSRSILEELRIAEQLRIEEERKAQEAAKAAAAARAEAEARLAEAQKAIELADAARAKRAEMNKRQSKTSEVFKTAIATSDNVPPPVSALGTVLPPPDFYVKNTDDSNKEGFNPNRKSPFGNNKVNLSEISETSGSGATSGVGASAAAQSADGSYLSKEQARASSNANQLGTMLGGKQGNSVGRVPVWAEASIAGLAAFKESDEAREARIREEQMRIEEEKAKKESEEAAKAQYTSIVDNVKTHKSAFFNRTQTERPASAGEEEHTSAYGGIVRPSGIVDKEREINKSNEPAMGAALEGQRPSIMDPNVGAAPTAEKPLAGFRGADTEADSDEGKN